MTVYKNVKNSLVEPPRTCLITGVAGFIGSHILDELPSADEVVLAVAHKSYHKLNVEDFNQLVGDNVVVMDVKCLLERKTFADANIDLWRL
ncbi:NAD-dependent epimerase/dehydratase family protein [Neptunomonas antarctica]|uniref:UDP-N-acetylglucosamine 4-epimerase n=1 Tax=Neptunomonas antarctica TaxID=619304 RepID=A0A1N7JF17_9GAMM|nr:NAD-dependent epimerase/dehydratase family protein [Neptunomonas antarctica]SIS47945.1 UDP-N-acetylglucosamine 4-epimerase [Neptunomonas antarctica]